MAALQRDQLSKLCSSSETFEKALSILRLANAKTRPGSGFVVKNPIAIPAVCAYLASEQLNTNEVSLQSAMSASCVKRLEFTDTLNTISSALRSEERSTVANVTYETLVDTHHVQPREDAIGCMEDAEAALPCITILKEKYSANVLSCAIFYWVCQLMEEPSVQERSLCRSYSIHPKTFKAVVTALDKQGDSLADQIKSYLLQKRSSTEVSNPPQPAMRTQTRTGKMSTPVATPLKKRTVAFSCPPSGGDGDRDGGTSFPETPTKKRRIDALSPTKPSACKSPTKRSFRPSTSTTAFHAALKGSPTKRSVEQESESPGVGPSTPHRPRHAKFTATPSQADSQPSPSRSQGQISPTRSVVRRRFRPIFLEQQQWYARDPKVEQMWAAAEALRDGMV